MAFLFGKNRTLCVRVSPEVLLFEENTDRPNGFIS